jgi:hypothetical protein
MSKPAPLIFLLGTSTAGKGTIYKEISRQDQASENLGFETWGVDEEAENEMVRCRDLLKDDARFSAIESKFPEVRKIVTGIYFGEIKDSETGEIFKLNADEKLDDFLAQTGGRYDKEALKILKAWANEEPNHFKEVADLTNEGMRARAFERAVDHAIENSKKGIPTILDMVPDSAGGDMVAAFEAHLAKRNFTCPTHVVLVHLPVADLTERMDQRNQKALAPGGNINDQRNEIFPFEQYASIFGSSAEGNLGILRADDIHQAIEKFGGTDEAKKLRAEKELLGRLGFEEGQTSITVGATVKADVVCEHSDAGSTVQIAEAICSWTKEKMLEKQVQDAEEKTDKFSEKYPSRKDGNKSFSEAVLAADDGKSGGRC